MFITTYIQKAKSCLTTRHEGAWGRGGTAPTHSRPRHYMGVSGQRPRFTPGERTPGTHCTGGWVGPRAGLDTEATEKILSSLPGIEPRSPGRPARSQTPYWLSYPCSRWRRHLVIDCSYERNKWGIADRRHEDCPSAWRMDHWQATHVVNKSIMLRNVTQGLEQGWANFFVGGAKRKK
jgi:hypothetical protein